MMGEGGFDNRISRPDAVERELFANRFIAIAGEMGEMLRRTAVSTNVKERLDFSCAILDDRGRLVVNAPHIPVHLGSLGLCVRGIRELLEMEPGDVVVTNHPAHGGTHLPDITVVTPVFTGGASLIGYVASRAHHAEIGGIMPGSIPHNATNLSEEGVVIPPVHLVKKGRARWDKVKKYFTDAIYPTRALDENIADLRAAVAANHRGAGALKKLAEVHGAVKVALHMDSLRMEAEKSIRKALARLGKGKFEATELLDDGSPIKVVVDLKNDGAVIDFSGSADVHPGNLNATPAVVASAVLYVLRLLVKEPLPLNEGFLEAVEVFVPKGMLNPEFPDDPTKAPAICAGNVETSQRIVDCLLRALRIAAGSQGTMNNVTFGTDKFSYFETLCGGEGAGPDFDGACAVHTHMTNTRITDPEILEHRYPVRLEKFALRPGSGGKGKHDGGDGVVREITFLEEMDLSITSQHRTIGPYGMEGGEPGRPGCQRIVRASGEVEELDAIDGRKVKPGDRLIIETPGGGGWGTNTI